MAISSPTTVTDPGVEKSHRFLRHLLRDYGPRDFAVRFWDGTTLEPDAGRLPRFTLVLKHAGALRGMFWPPNELSLAEAYIYDDIDIEGDFNSIFVVGDYFVDHRWSLRERLGQAVQLMMLPSGKNPRRGRHRAHLTGNRHSKSRDREAVSYHYDTSNEFFELWLDSRMVYSCAYFASPDDDLETAQERKLSYICKKLRLQPGERMLDIGCGWGGLILFAASHYDVEADGVTLSVNQADLANQRIQEAGLQDRCRVKVLDYRDVEGVECYDKISSVGMFEHVGEKMLPTYFERTFTLLRPGGAFFNQGLAHPPSQPQQRSPSFTDRFNYPDYELVPISSTLRIAEDVGYEVRDVECLREHEALTMRKAVERLEERYLDAVRASDEATYRTWRLFLAGLAHECEIGWVNLYHSLFVKPERGNANVPLTRTDWYA